MGLRPTLTYDPSTDKTEKSKQKLLDSLARLLQIRHAKDARAQNIQHNIFSSELGSIRKKGLTVDVQKYFDDANYRASIKKDEASYDKIHMEAKTHSSGSKGSISPIIQSIGATLNVYPDISPKYIMDNDIDMLQKILLKGDENLNQLAVIDLSASEVEGISGLEQELGDMGIWQEGESWETADGVLGVKDQLEKRLDWFIESYKDENNNYVATQSEADALARSEMLTVQSRLNTVKSFSVYQDMVNADASWDRAQGRLFPVNPDNPDEVYDTETGKFMSLTDFQGAYKETGFVMRNSVQDLYEFMKDDYQGFEDMMKSLQKERPEVYGMVAGLVSTYDKGKGLWDQVEQNIDPVSYMDLQSASLRKLEDLETAQHDIAPIAQELANLRVMKSGNMGTNIPFNAGQLEERITGLEKKLSGYFEFKHGQFLEGEYTLRIDELTDLYNNIFNQHTSNLFTDKDEVHPDSRQEYFDAVQDLDYNNIINSVDLLIQEGK